VVLFGLSLGTNIILAHSLGPAGRGAYAIAVLFPSILTLLASLGVGAANVYHVSRGTLDKRHVVAVSTIAAILLGGISYAGVLALTRVAGGSTVFGIQSSYLLLSCLSVPFTLAAYFMQGVLQGERRFLAFNAVLVCQYLSLFVMLALILLAPGDRVRESILAWTASAVLSGLLALALVGVRTRPSSSLHPATVRAIFRFGSLTYLGSLTSFINYRFDLLLVNAFVGATQAGLYAVGAGLAEVIWFLPNSASIALAPRAAAASEIDAAELSAQASRSITAVTLLCALLMAPLASPAVMLFFGSAFAASVDAVWLLLPGIVTFSTWKIFSAYLVGRNMLKADLLAASVAMAVTLALDLLLIPRYGFRGAAVASSAAYTVARRVDLWWVRRRSGLSLSRWLIPVRSDAEPVVSRLRPLLARIRPDAA